MSDSPSPASPDRAGAGLSMQLTSQAGCVEGLAVCPGSVASGEFLLSHRVAKNGGLGLTRG